MALLPLYLVGYVFVSEGQLRRGVEILVLVTKEGPPQDAEEGKETHHGHGAAGLVE
jgi:hypothetical protein